MLQSLPTGTETHTPRVSVVMSAYNSSLYLPAAIESILCQTLTDFEFIIVDDGSTDETWQIFEKYQAQDSRLRIFLLEHQGLIPALNFGLSQARAPWIARMDADDIAHPDRFTRQMDYLDKNPQVVVLGSSAEMIDPDGAPLGIVEPDYDPALVNHKLITGKGAAIWHPTVIMDAATVQKVGGYRLGFEHAEDTDLWLRMAEQGELANLKDVLLKYRQHPSSICATRRREQRKSLMAAVREAHLRRGLPVPAEFENPRVDTRQLSDARTRWVRIALRYGHPETAVKHARQLLAQKPLSLETWLTLLRFAPCPWQLLFAKPAAGPEHNQRWAA